MRIRGLSFWMCFALYPAWAEPLEFLQLDSVPIWNPGFLQVTEEDQYPVLDNDSTPLEINGYKSFRMVTGADGVSVEQNLRLGIVGEVHPGWFVEARLVDEGLAPGEVRVSTLDQIDEIYFRLLHGKGRITLGNFSFNQDSLSLVQVNHASMGAHLEWLGDQASGQWSLGRDPVQRRSVAFWGRDGQQGGYLVAPDGISDIAVVPGSERVYLNGKPLQAGVDYWLNPVGGVLDFKGLLLPGPRDYIQVEFEEHTIGGVQQFSAGHASYRTGPLSLHLLGSGSWYPAQESDTALQRHGQSDWGGRIAWNAGDLGSLWLEAVLGKVDSASGIPGKAYAWALQGDKSWEERARGFRFEYHGSLRDSLFKGKQMVQSYEDLSRWGLFPESLPNRTEHQLKLGFEFQGNWLPWVEGGLLGEPGNMAYRNASIGIDHKPGEVLSQVQLGILDAKEDPVDRRRWELVAKSEDLEGWWRPRSGLLGEVSGVRMEMHAWSGIGYGDFSWLTGNGEVRGEWLEDSAWSRDFRHSLEMVGKTFQGSSLFQWKESATALDRTSGQSWISDQQLHWNTESVQSQFTHRLGKTQEHPLVPNYKRVPAGTGDILYDSLTGNYVENVDMGDFVLDGYVREDSLGDQILAETALEWEGWISPGSLLGIRKGFLRDLRLGLSAASSVRDSMGVHWIPAWRTHEIRQANDGSLKLAGNVEIMNQAADFLGTLDAGISVAKQPGGYGQIEDEKRQGFGFEKGIGETWRLEPRYARTIFGLLEPTPGEWTMNEWEFALEKEFPMEIRIKPKTRYRTMESLRLWQQSLSITKSFQDHGEVQMGYSLTSLSGFRELIPWKITEGYAEGLSHRFEASANYDFQERIRLQFQYLFRSLQGSNSQSHRLSGEVRAFFQ